MLMILARLVRSESFWAVAKVRSPHTVPGISYIIALLADIDKSHSLAPRRAAPPEAKKISPSSARNT